MLVTSLSDNDSFTIILTSFKQSISEELKPVWFTKVIYHYFLFLVLFLALEGSCKIKKKTNKKDIE